LKNEELIQKAHDLGFDYEKTYRGCGQCSIAALQDTFGVSGDEIFQAATAFAGGVNRCGDSGCGAYLGGVMFLASLRGRDRDHFAEGARTRETMTVAKSLHDRFIEEYGSVNCHAIHTKLMGRPFYIIDPDEMRKFDEAGAHTTKCTEVVGKASAWVAEIALDAGLVK
jgi:C_GCAxxG_C_C family probable redox protein